MHQSLPLVFLKEIINRHTIWLKELLLNPILNSKMYNPFTILKSIENLQLLKVNYTGKKTKWLLFPLKFQTIIKNLTSSNLTKIQELKKLQSNLHKLSILETIFSNKLIQKNLNLNCKVSNSKPNPQEFYLLVLVYLK